LLAAVKSFLACESGATALEYSLLASLIAVVIAGIVQAMFTQLSSEYSVVSSVFK